MSALPKPSDRRRIIAAARLLQSDKPGEVVAAVGAIGRLLHNETLSDVIERGVGPAPLPRPAPASPTFVYRGDWKYRARMVQCCPHLTEWERGFVADIIHLSSLSDRQESRLKAIFRKSERPSL